MRVMLLLVAFGLSLVSAVPHDSAPKHAKNAQDHYAGGEHHDHVDHESILGSSDAAEEYDTLSPEESKRRLRVLVERMDRNKDGQVDYEELADWIQTSLQQLDEEEIRERFPTLDIDKDGKVSWEEYLVDAFGEDWKDDKDSVEFMKEDEKYFKAADRDVDGKLTPAEFAAFQRPENHEHMAEALVKLTMDERDLNKDGILTFDEYMSNIDKSKDKEWWDMEKQQFENEHDKNKDGILDAEEIRDWLNPNTKEAAREEAAHLIQETDADKNNILSYAEIVDKHELWVGSEATAYGEHLNKMEL